MPSFTLNVRVARRLPDPLSNSTHATERHIFFVPVRSLPPGLPTDPSPRSARRWDIYKEVRASLLNQNCVPGSFHLKNRGITIVARAVEKLEENEYEVHIGSGQGVVDGANTYAVIREALADKSIEVPAQQFVKVEVITRLPETWVAEIANALNTSMQSQPDSMRHLAEAVGWLRDELADRRYFKSIAWSEEQRGDFDVKELLSVLTCFNTASYPNNGANHPVVAYDNRAVVLNSFEQDFKAAGGRAYKRLRPILREILVLHDVIQSEFPKFLRQSTLPADGLVESSGDKPFRFLFLGATGDERLARGPLYSILAAFRWLVDDDPTKEAVSWRGGFENVLRRWRELAPKFVQLSVERLREVEGGAEMLGKSVSHWGMLHREVALAELMAAQQAPAASEAAPVPQAPLTQAADAGEDPTADEGHETPEAASR